MLAVQILSDLVFWYRPYEKRHELTGESLGWRKKFAEEHLRRSPDALSKIFNTSVKCVRESIKVLVNLGLITVILKPVKTVFGVFPNVMHITLIPERIAQITHQMSEGETAETIEKSLFTKWDTSKIEQFNFETAETIIESSGAMIETAETIEKSLLPKKDTCSAEGVIKQVLNEELAATEQESYLYIENSIKNSTEISLPSLSPQPANQEERENQFGFQIPKNESKKLESPINSSVLLTKAESTLKKGTFAGETSPAKLPLESQSVETVPSVAKNENNYQNQSLPQKYDPYFGRSRMKPNEAQWDWLPPGAWMVEETGKLDENFLQAIACRWATEYGGKAADKRPNVIKHFRNNPTNLPIEWEWYQEKYLHKAANVQVRKINGLDTAEDEAEIMKHQRALVPLDASHCVTEIRTPVEIVQQSAPYALESIQASRINVLSGISEGHEAYTQTANPEDSSFWAKLAGRERSQNRKPSQDASEDVVNAGEGLSRCKSIIDALQLNRESSKKTPAIQMDSTPLDHDQILEDMRKRLKSGVETITKEAIAWVADVNNGCELVVENGKAIDIKEIDF